LRATGLFLIAAVLLGISVTSCAGTNSHLVITQTTDVPLDKDHKGHLAPGAFATITVSIRNTGRDPARGLTVQDVLPSGFHYYSLTTLGGNAIRTSWQEPPLKGDPEWGVFTIPAGNSSRESQLVVSFKVQAASKPGEYSNAVKIKTATPGELDKGEPVVLVVEPRPSLNMTAASTTGEATAGGTVTYLVSVENVGSAVAKGVTVSVNLPPGFLYLSTNGYEGNSSRVAYVDPPGSSLLPVWSSWNVPAMSDTGPGFLRIIFQSRILSGVHPGLYSLTAVVTGGNDTPMLSLGDSAPVKVGKSRGASASVRVAATGVYVSQPGTVTYAISVENVSTEAALDVVVTDSLPEGFTYQQTNSITVAGQVSASRLQPQAGNATPRWGPFNLPGGGVAGASIVIWFTANVSGASLGPHPNVVSGSSSNTQITGGSDQNPVVVTAS
jgi:uncharacterized repeat protein (TIGR01451 family)